MKMQTGNSTRGRRTARLLAWDGWVEVMPTAQDVPARRQYWRQALAFVLWFGVMLLCVLTIAGRWGFWRSWPVSVPVTALALWLVFRSIPVWLREARWEDKTDRWLSVGFICVLAGAAGFGVCAGLGASRSGAVASVLLVGGLLLAGYQRARQDARRGAIRCFVHALLQAFTQGAWLVCCLIIFCAIAVLLLTYAPIDGPEALREYAHANPEGCKEILRKISIMGSVLLVLTGILLPFCLLLIGALVPKHATLPCRIRLQTGRIVTGVFRTFVLPVYLVSISTFFRPLALEAPPQDSGWHWVTEPDPIYAGGRNTERLIQECATLWQEERDEAVTKNANGTQDHGSECQLKDLANQTRSQLHGRKWDSGWVDANLTQALEMTSRLATDMAFVCSDERPASVLSREFPFLRNLPIYVGVLSWTKLEPARRMDLGGTDATIQALREGIAIANYCSRGYVCDWLVGMLMWREIAGHVFRLTESTTLDAETAAKLDELLAEGLASTGSWAGMVRHEMKDNFKSEQLLIRHMYRPDVRLRWLLDRRPTENAVESEELWNTMRRSWFLFNTFLGNDLEGTLRVHRHSLMSLHGDEEFAEAGHRFWRRGWIGVKKCWPLLGWLHVHHAYANVNAARMALALAMIRSQADRDGVTAEAAAKAFERVASESVSEDRPITHIRLDLPTDAVEGASAYALACWADGRAVKPGGGTVWLVVRNPAFGELPFRVFHWVSSGGAKGGVHVNEIVLAHEPLAETDDQGRLPKLEIPADLFRGDAEAWSAAWDAMKRAGWRW